MVDNVIDKDKETFKAEKVAFEKEKVAFNALKADKTKQQLKFDMMKPVVSRMRTRIREMQELSQTKHQKIMRGNVPFWISTEPVMKICGLHASMSNGVVKISYQVYKTDKNRDKVSVPQYTTVEGPNGTTKKVVSSITYPFEKFVVETIEHLKPMKVEEFKEPISEKPFATTMAEEEDEDDE